MEKLITTVIIVFRHLETHCTHYPYG